MATEDNATRNAELVSRFKAILEGHIDDLLSGRVEKMFEIREIADMLCLHPNYLSKIIRLETGHHACYFYEQKILSEAKKLLADLSLTIKTVALKLDYDNSNFTKLFKRFTGLTPSEYRKSLDQK